ncbi:sigma factor [Yinghuangia seranimata]|uniref:sigma factor n=1 Tax=Yinghuangia seranimata TaxID=408067 RepID=UPI00248D39A1|nr:sigma factor [Yinghuangia seranimata]MDI2126544.1 sigma factor [Yinghuangia seranimata]
MDGDEWLAGRFAEHRPQLWAVAFRLSGSAGEADDALREAWPRVGRAAAGGGDELAAWLTGVVGRVAVGMLRDRAGRGGESGDARVSADTQERDGAGPEDAGVQGDAVGLAMLVVLEALSPAERLAFVLHDVFGVPVERVAPVVGRSTAVTRQLAGRARRRVRGTPPDPVADAACQREVVADFVAAFRAGEFEVLVRLLDPDVVLRADAVVVEMGSPAEVRGAVDVAEMFSGRARAARPAVVDGLAGLVWVQGGVPRVVFTFVVVDGVVAGIDLVGDGGAIGAMEIEFGEG